MPAFREMATRPYEIKVEPSAKTCQLVLAIRRYEINAALRLGCITRLRTGLMHYKTPLTADSEQKLGHFNDVAGDLANWLRPFHRQTP
jgi:hypothetical protein